MSSKAKKAVITHLPYLFIALIASKLGLAWRLAEGTDASQKLLNLMDTLAVAFSSLTPSLHPFDLCVGLMVAIAIRAAVYAKGKNAKKYRKNMEYGSARCGA